MLNIIESGTRYGVPQDSLWLQFQRLFTITASTPQDVNRTPVTEIDQEVGAGARQAAATLSIADFAVQTRAVMAQDVARDFDGDLGRAAAAVRARMLVVYSWDDHLVSAGPAAEFARLLGADSLAIPSSCGHGVIGCAQERIGATVGPFLAR
jgi:homoserine acetyltransferase